MDSKIFKALVKVASQVHSFDRTLPGNYIEVRAAAIAKFPKLASLGVSALEVAGLGVLAKPSVDEIRDPHASQQEKKKAKYETAGLGILAAHPAYEIGKAGIDKYRRWAIASKLRNAAKGFKIPQLG